MAGHRLHGARRQEAERDDAVLSSFSPSMQSGPPAHGMAPPTVRAGLPTSINLIYNSLTDTPRRLSVNLDAAKMSININHNIY